MAMPIPLQALIYPQVMPLFCALELNILEKSLAVILKPILIVGLIFRLQMPSDYVRTPRMQMLQFLVISVPIPIQVPIFLRKSLLNFAWVEFAANKPRSSTTLKS